MTLLTLLGRLLVLMLLATVGVPGQAAPPPASIRVVLDDNYPPYSFRDSSGQVQGIRKDLWGLWQQRTGVAVDFQPMDWGKARAITESGQADVIDTIFETEERRKIYDFSRPYATIEVPIFFHRSISGITDAASIKGFTVGVKEGDACVEYLKTHGIADLKRYASYEAQVKAAIRQEIRVLCIDKPAADYFFNREGAADEFRQSPPLYVGDLRWAVAKGKIDLKHLVEEGFSRITADERAAIETRWQGKELAGGLGPGVARYGGYVLLAVALTIITLFAWNWTLRRRVAARAAELGTANSSLRESEARFRSLTEMSSDFYWESDVEHRLTARASANKKLSTVSTFERGTQIGERRWEIPYLSSDEAGWQAYRAVLDAHRPFRNFELSRLGADGSERHILISGDPVFDVSGVFTGYRGVGADITERKDAEAKIVHLNRVYAMLGGINALIVRVRHRDELFREACRIAVEAGGFRMSLIGIVDRNAMTIVPVASAGKDEELLASIKDILSSAERAPNTMMARAIRGKKAVLANDSRSDPQVVFGEKYAESGVRAIAVLPLMVSDEAVGVLALYASESEFFHDEEMKLLSQLAGDISFAMENITREHNVAKLARIRTVSSEINAAIIRIQHRNDLFIETCRIAVEHGGFEIAWISLLDPASLEIAPTACAGVDSQVFLTLPPASAQPGTPQSHSELGRAIREKRAVFSNDLVAESGVGGARRQEAIRRGYRSAIAIPLLVDDAVVAILALYARESNFFNPDELNLLAELASNISFALTHIEKQERLDYLAYYDALTGLANRSLFLDRVAQYLRSAASGEHKLAVFLIDLERFKNINDSLGRAAGDALLRQVAEWLTHNAGDANLLARVDADHFVAVMPVVKQERDVARPLEKMMAAFLDHPFRLNDAVFRVAAKVGVALFPDDGADADTLYKNAEAALKKAKASGERYLFYTQKMTEAVAGKLTLENQLRQALDQGEFVLHYQPKVNLASGKLTGAEALIRWNDPRTGLAPPGRFIPILEEIGLIYEVGRWALRQAIADYLRWRAAGLPAVRVAVNVSPLQLRHRDFVTEVKRQINIDAQAAAGLELEITESLIMEDVKHNIASLQAIRDLGVGIAIDDFGTGFSSLSYLAKLPVNTLKIDRSFIIEMTVAPEGLAVVSTVIKLAHSLKLKVVAEGVETEEQSRLLRLLACDEMQGFLFSKPVPAEIFETRFLAPPAAG